MILIGNEFLAENLKLYAARANGSYERVNVFAFDRRIREISGKLGNRKEKDISKVKSRLTSAQELEVENLRLQVQAILNQSVK